LKNTNHLQTPMFELLLKQITRNLPQNDSPHQSEHTAVENICLNGDTHTFISSLAGVMTGCSRLPRFFLPPGERQGEKGSRAASL
jgi:hypothetical protein